MFIKKDETDGKTNTHIRNLMKRNFGRFSRTEIKDNIKADFK